LKISAWPFLADLCNAVTNEELGIKKSDIVDFEGAFNQFKALIAA
jgi:hypothetical protein